MKLTTKTSTTTTHFNLTVLGWATNGCVQHIRCGTVRTIKHDKHGRVMTVIIVMQKMVPKIIMKNFAKMWKSCQR